ncbi:MAG: RHS repeat-associated core domain-containing protein [Paludibacter sp.]|nr:RHS repeat-associated core domain-containing protein [Paludibacter sp.]
MNKWKFTRIEIENGGCILAIFYKKVTLRDITQITNNSGNLAAEYSYDAWGRMRNPVNWQVYAQGSQHGMNYGGRGYTGHEHLNQFGLINMNARLYDPLLARFLAPDPFVGSGLTNDFNRYIYCRNNPLMFTDPSGKSFASWWKRNIADPFMREVHQVFGNGFTIGFGTDTQFSSMNAVIAPNGPNEMPYGPGFGVQTSNFKNFTPVAANYQGGFFSTQPVNFESNLQQSVVNAEQNARSEYFGQKTIESTSNFFVNLYNLLFVRSEEEALYGKDAVNFQSDQNTNQLLFESAGTLASIGAFGEESIRKSYKPLSIISTPLTLYNTYSSIQIYYSGQGSTINGVDGVVGLADFAAAFNAFGNLNPYIKGGALIYGVGRLSYEFLYPSPQVGQLIILMMKKHHLLIKNGK